MVKSKSLSVKEPKYSLTYWANQIQDAEKRHKAFFFKEAEESIRVYNTRHKLENIQRRVNVWWYIVNTMMPAFYSSTPKAEVNLRKYAGSQILDLSAVLLERNTQYCMDMDFDFDFVGYNSALQWLLTGRAVLWARKDTEFGEGDKLELFPADDGFYDANGRKFEDISELEETKEGRFILHIPNIESERGILESLQYCDYLNSDARNEEEVEWRAKKAYMCREEAVEMFGSDAEKTLSFDQFPDSSREDRKVKTDDRNSRDGKAALWEIWCEEQEKQIFIQANGKKSFMEVGDAPIEYAGFYPCSVINTSIDPDSTIPTSDYSHAKDQILEVERLAERKHAMIQAIRANGIFDATFKPLEDIFRGDLKMTPVMNWPNHTQRGGAAARMEYLNIEPYVSALGVLSEQLEQAKQSLFQTLRVSDLLQGTSDPRKTATANRLENQWSSLGLIVRQNQFAKFIGDGIEKLGTIIATFEDQTLLDRGDAEGLLEPLVTDQMPYEVLAQEVLNPLRDTRELFKLEIASDSMIALNQTQERQDNADLLNSIGAFFSQQKDMVVEYPALMPLSVKLLEKTIRSYKGGKEVEAVFIKALNDINIASQQKAAMAAQQPPDPKVIESQTRLQIAQMESQSKVQAAQVEAQDKHEKNMLEMQKISFETQMEQRKTQFDEWKAQQDIVMKQQELAIKARSVEVDLIKVQSESENKQATLMLNEKIAAIDTLLQQQAMRLEAGDKRLSITEQLLEERRLSHEAGIEQRKLELQAEEVKIKKEELAHKKEVSKKKPGRKVGKVSSDGTSFEIQHLEDD